MNADEIVRALRVLLPAMVDYAELVGTEGVTHGQHFVWDGPEPYVISAAADLIESLQAQLEAVQHRERAAIDMWQKCLNRLCYSCHNGNASSQVKHSGSCETCPWRGPEDEDYTQGHDFVVSGENRESFEEAVRKSNERQRENPLPPFEMRRVGEAGEGKK